MAPKRRLAASSSASGAPSADVIGAQERGLALEIGFGRHRAAEWVIPFPSRPHSPGHLFFLPIADRDLTGNLCRVAGSYRQATFRPARRLYFST